MSRTSESDLNAIAGVAFVQPQRNPDDRGSLDVVFSSSWPGVPPMAQLNLVRSRALVLRGLHAHSRYAELYAPALGRMFIALKDARSDSPTFGRVMSTWLDQDEHYKAALVPAGVLHGVYFATDGVLAYGLTESWTGLNEFNCAWDDADVGIDWPTDAPLLSPRDATAGRYVDLVRDLNRDRGVES